MLGPKAPRRYLAHHISFIYTCHLLLLMQVQQESSTASSFGSFAFVLFCLYLLDRQLWWWSSLPMPFGWPFKQTGDWGRSKSLRLWTPWSFRERIDTDWMKVDKQDRRFQIKVLARSSGFKVNTFIYHFIILHITSPFWRLGKYLVMTVLWQLWQKTAPGPRGQECLCSIGGWSEGDRGSERGFGLRYLVSEHWTLITEVNGGKPSNPKMWSWKSWNS